MKQYRMNKSFASVVLACTMAILPIASIAQTRVSMPKNKYKVQDDVKLGNDASRQVRQQFPLLNDRLTQSYVSSVGEKLVAAIPPQFQQPAFDYRFEVVDASDINAFALPGGPLYVNRGMIQAARNEGEMAGVMAHEISHVALRHATAQQTKVSSPLNQILGIGAILGGAVLGGQSGAQLGQVFAAGYFLRYSRDYETQADVLGAQIMANAGYDPRDLANIFRTIEQRSGRRGGPEWLSSHPDPGNRYQSINREASLLRVSPNPIKLTPGFQRAQERLGSMPRARTMEEIQRTGGRRGTVQDPSSGGRYAGRVELPSTRTRVYQGGNWVQISVPANWREFSSESAVQFAPEGGYGDQGITHGAIIGLERSGNGGDAYQATESYVSSLLQGNSYLRAQSGISRMSFGGREGYATVLAGRSPVTAKNEVVTVYTTLLRNGYLFYVATVVPQNEAYNYNGAFRNMLSSIRLND